MDEPIRVSKLERELTSLLNLCCAEVGSNTPDFILAKFLLGCLAAWDAGVGERERWYGRDPGNFPALDRIESDATLRG